MRILGVIPARGGSKGVPRKNVRALAGKPLVVWTIEAALSASHLDRIVLSTDDEEIAQAGRNAGIDVPWLRPSELAQDATPTLPVIEHAVGMAQGDGDDFDAVCLLQPTNPFRTPGLIDACLDRFVTSGADSLVTVLRVPDEHNPHWVYFEQDGRLVLSTGAPTPIARRQDLPAAYHREGSVYVTSINVLASGSLYGERVIGFEVDATTSVNIDDEDDWARAERLLARRAQP